MIDSLSDNMDAHMCYAITDDTNIRLIRLLAIISALVGIGARVVAFDEIPMGFNQDEASIGYEAWSLIHYGIDRNGFRWPVHLMSWGDGQNVLYAYLSGPFVAFGLSSFTVRLPMLLTAMASLPLIWKSAHELFGEKAAWCVLTVTALSPWHIMLSRWALESNLMPFVFVCGLTCLCLARHPKYQTPVLIAACVFFALCMYAYGTAYLAAPIFLLGALVLGVLEHTFSLRQTIVGAASFVIVSVPIGLYVLINLLGWHTLSLGGITIPRLAVAPRLETMMTQAPFVDNAAHLWQLLLSQSDGRSYNVTEPYGIVYSDIFLVIAVGVAIVSTFRVIRGSWPPCCALLAWWLLSTIPTGILQPPNINRINLLLMGLIFAAGIGVAELDNSLRGIAAIAMLTLLICCSLFLHTYIGEQPRAPQFAAGLLQALQRAQHTSSAKDNICVTGQVNVPYIYALFTEKTDPSVYLRTVKYDELAPTRQAMAFGRYTFGLQRCDFHSTKVVVTTHEERPPKEFRLDRVFGSFDVYLNAGSGTDFPRANVR